jgi:hypothetical protein
MELQVLQEVTLHQQVKEDKDSINQTMNKWIIIKKTKTKKKALEKRKHKTDRMVKKEANKNNKMMMHKMMDNQMKINDILY